MAQGCRSPPEIDPLLAHIHSLPPACLARRLAGTRFGSESVAVNTQLCLSASEEFGFQLTARHTGVWGKQLGWWWEEAGSNPLTSQSLLHLMCQEAESWRDFFF
jgi:hypothetical protein